jgi:hypothetical protein
LLIKRWHASRRRWSIWFGFFFLSIIIEIVCVFVVPTPREIQSALLQNERVIDARVKFDPSIYNPQTIVTYANENSSQARPNLIGYLSSRGATIDEIQDNQIGDYVRQRYLQSTQSFVHQYQLSFASFVNSSTSSLTFDAHFSTVNYHTMPTSLNVATNNLFQFFANSTSKSIATVNQPIITKPKGASYIAQVLDVLYCFEVFPVSLFSFLNSILVTIFIGVLLLSLTSERLNHSKDLQLLTNTSRTNYWLAHWLFDFLLCSILCALLTIVVQVMRKLARQ